MILAEKMYKECCFLRIKELRLLIIKMLLEKLY